MTLRFLEEYRITTTCSACKSAPAVGRRTCERHLAQAREAFRLWMKERAAKKLCISCDRRSYKGECRCLLHKGVNQERCRSWYKAHKEQEAFRHAFQVAFLKEFGGCVRCRREAIAESSASKCESCLERQRGHNRRSRQGASA